VTAPPPKRYREIAPLAPDGELDLPTLIPGEGPLELDVGFGRGLSLFERARAAPDARIVGIEVKMKLAYLADRRRARLGLERVRVLAGDARDILRRAGPPGCLARAFLHFPDPWWKKRHAKRRIVDSDLLDMLGGLLRPGGEVFVQTDVESRAVDYVAQLDAHPAFELLGRRGRVDNNPFDAVSNRERRALRDGLPVFRVLARRVKGRERRSEEREEE
jgi:tRNA (guanine-N7-)-methyltransferase